MIFHFALYPILRRSRRRQATSHDESMSGVKSSGVPLIYEAVAGNSEDFHGKFSAEKLKTVAEGKNHIGPGYSDLGYTLSRFWNS